MIETTSPEALARSRAVPVSERMRQLPLDPTRGIPVPWFVTWVDGKPEFRVAEAKKLVLAINRGLCWVCGQRLGEFKTFVLGPMCTVNRVSAEPPVHKECGIYSARACPFLFRPGMERREGCYPAAIAGDVTDGPGIMLRRNPGVVCLWVTNAKYEVIRDKGGVLFCLGNPNHVLWFAEGRAATRAEVLESVRTGLPALEAMARQQGRDAVAELARMAREAERFYPAGEGVAP